MSVLEEEGYAVPAPSRKQPKEESVIDKLVGQSRITKRMVELDGTVYATYDITVNSNAFLNLSERWTQRVEYAAIYSAAMYALIESKALKDDYPAHFIMSPSHIFTELMAHLVVWDSLGYSSAEIANLNVDESRWYVLYLMEHMDSLERSILSMDNKRFHCIKNWLWWVLAFLLWLFFCFLHLREYAYQYPYVQNKRILFLKTIPNLLLPLIPLIIGIFCSRNRTRNIRLICSCVFLITFVITLPFVWISSVQELLYTPAICSYTQNPEYYGQYDPEVSEAIELNAKGCLPKTIPSDAKDIHYCYLYEHAATDTIYISISWKCADDEMEKYQSNYTINSWEVYENGKKTAFLTEKSLSGNVQPYIHAVIIFDENDNTITHIVTNNTDFLPQNSTGKFIAPFLAVRQGAVLCLRDMRQ